MKSIIAIVSSILFAINVFAQSKPVTYNPATGKIKSPSDFVEKNHIVSNEVVCVRVDMLGGDKWTDAELKVLSPQGQLLCFATTMYEDVIMWHCPKGKYQDGITKNMDDTWDSACKIYYYVAGKHHNAWYGQCSNPKQFHPVDESNRTPICQKESARITAIEFYPDMSNETIRQIILNPDNTIIISRKTPDAFEKDEDMNRIWRPVIPQYYKTYPTTKK